MKEIRVGVVGIGHLGGYHLQKYRELSNCRIIGVAEPQRGARPERLPKCTTTARVRCCHRSPQVDGFG